MYVLRPWKVYNTKLNHIPLIQHIFSFLSINPTISQSFKYMERLKSIFMNFAIVTKTIVKIQKLIDY